MKKGQIVARLFFGTIVVSTAVVLAIAFIGSADKEEPQTMSSVPPVQNLNSESSNDNEEKLGAASDDSIIARDELKKKNIIEFVDRIKALKKGTKRIDVEDVLGVPDHDSYSSYVSAPQLVIYCIYEFDDGSIVTLEYDNGSLVGASQAKTLDGKPTEIMLK